MGKIEDESNSKLKELRVRIDKELQTRKQPLKEEEPKKDYIAIGMKLGFGMFILLPLFIILIIFFISILFLGLAC